MTTAHDLFKTFKGLNVRQYAFIQRDIEVAKNMARLERVSTMLDCHRYYLKFDDGSLMEILVDSGGYIVTLKAYNPVGDNYFNDQPMETKEDE